MIKHIRTDLALELNEDFNDDSIDNGIEVNSKLICDGNIKETVIKIKHSRREIIVKEDMLDLDGLNYLSGKSMHEIN